MLQQVEGFKLTTNATIAMGGYAITTGSAALTTPPTRCGDTASSGWRAFAWGGSSTDSTSSMALQDPNTNPAALAQADWLSRRALVLEESDAEVWWARALCLEKQGDLSGALEAIRTATHLGPRNFYVWRAQAHLLERADRVPEALESLSQAIAALKGEAAFGEHLVNTVVAEREQMRQRHPAAATVEP